MTISSVVPVNNYLGNGSTTTFDFDFLIENGSQLVVTKTDSNGNIVTLVENLDYSVHETGNISGSYITFPVASSAYSVLSSYEVLTLSLDLDIKQESSFPPDIKLSLPVIEHTFDYVVRLLQILNRKLERAIKVKESPNIDTESLVNNIDKIGINLPVLSNINSNISNINAVNSNKTNIDKVAAIDGDVTTVAGIDDKVTAVAGMSSNIQSCVTNMTDINNAATNAQSASDKADEASASASNALASENLAKNWATKTNGTVDGSEYSAKYYAIQARDESAITFSQLNANLGYERNELISDDRLYNQIYKYTHSTFDSTKFTATGSPTVSADGIASGFSSSNYLVANQTIDFTKSFKIVYNEKKGTATKFNGFQVGVSGSISTPLFFVQASATNILTWGLYIDGTLTANDYSFSHADYTDINYIVSWDNTNYSLVVENAITHETILTQTVANATALKNSSSSTGVIVYGYNFNNAVAIQSTDLKQTSAENNDVPIFSGNKTGIDTFKANNYTLISSPTVTADGIASNFGTNGINTEYSLNPDGSSWSINIPFRTGTNISAAQAILNAADSFVVSITSSKLYCGVANGVNINSIFWEQYIADVTTNTNYIIKIEYDKTTYTVSLSTNGGNFVQKFTYDSSVHVAPKTGSPYLYIGRLVSSVSYSFKGSIDLNLFKIYVDGDLVYQPCLKIPYTESLTGSKVVDSVYFDRVQSVYDLYGKALYYTIDETNQKAALPMGEVYGYITQNAEDIETKAELDFSNISSTGIETALGWGMPDTANRVLVNSGVLTTEVSYTAPSKGYIAPNFVNFHSAYLKINDVGIYNETFTVSNGHSKTIIGFIPVEKNDVIKAYSDYNQASYGDQEIYFYPMKGV